MGSFITWQNDNLTQFVIRNLKRTCFLGVKISVYGFGFVGSFRFY